MTMPNIIVGSRFLDTVTPATASFDFNTSSILDQAGPYWVSLVAWVETADALAGFLGFSMTHRDPAGNDILSPDIAGNLNLADSTSQFNTPVVVLQRQSGSSLWTLDTAILFGIAGSAKIAYRFMVFPIGADIFLPL